MLKESKTKKRIQVVTWSMSPNYGTVLQAFSLIKALETCGYDARLLVRFDRRFSAVSMRKAFFGMIGFRKFWKEDKSLRTTKMKRIRSFHSKFFRQQYVVFPCSFRKLLKDTTAFIAGSDQIWNCRYRFDPFCFLDFAPSSKKISYASSIGTGNVPEECRDKVRSLLLDFKKISVREETAREYLSGLTGRKDIERVLDPTFLLGPEDWDSFWQEYSFVRYPLPEKFILCYFLNGKDSYIQALEEVKAAYGIDEVIMVPSGENPDMVIPNVRIFKDAGVGEFIQLLGKASVVCTDSFHGACLSINMSRRFVLFKRFEDSSPESQNSRLFDLLSMLGIEDRFYESGGEGWKTTLDFKEIKQNLDLYRRKSYDYLVNAIEN